ncbi:MAG: tRNA(5-methylaminomethyl-2-thiouridylate) methyltransferase [Desulfovibrionaceae bacterium]
MTDISLSREQYDALALFSGGLDSILAARTLMDQGLSVLGLHFTTPFFGKPHLLRRWREYYGVEVLPVDVSEAYCEMILNGPESGFGKQLNPCVDCKVLMLRRAHELMASFGARVIISGEVVGQRPMSQRPDALNLIRKRAGVGEVLLRPLSALRLEPTPVELACIVDRERLRDFYGRGRKAQLELAAHYGFDDVPTPAGGCVLAESEGAARFFRLLRAHEAAGTRPRPEDFLLAQTGRQLWAASSEGGEPDLWLCVGRNKTDNDRLLELKREGDLVFRTADCPGPVALARPIPAPGNPEAWGADAVRSAASNTASYSPKAVRAGSEARVCVEGSPERPAGRVVISVPITREGEPRFAEPNAEGLREWKAARLAR